MNTAVPGTRDAELAADRGVGDLQLRADPLHAGVDRQARLDADDHEVQRVRQAVREGLLVGGDGHLEPENRDHVADQPAEREAERHLVDQVADDVAADEADAEQDHLESGDDADRLRRVDAGTAELLALSSDEEEEEAAPE